MRQRESNRRKYSSPPTENCRLLKVTCREFFWMSLYPVCVSLPCTKKALNMLFFSQSQQQFQKGSVFSKGKFHACYGKHNSCEKHIPSSETLFMPTICTSSSLISLTTTIQVSAYVCSEGESGPYSCVCIK